MRIACRAAEGPGRAEVPTGSGGVERGVYPKGPPFANGASPVGSSPSLRGRPRRSLGQERAKRLQPWVDVIVGMVVGPLVERQAAYDAQARTVRPVEWRDRFGELDRLADRPLEIELVVIGQPNDVVRLVRRIRRQRRAGLEIDRRQRLLLELGGDRDLDVPQTAGAFHREGGRDVSVDEQA